nr:ubiquitin carboxyl-terminal hydrolase 15 [Quercus suber]
MLEPREADIPVLFLVLVVLPLVAYILLGKWSEVTKKRERISLLAQLAAEEAFKAEAMAMVMLFLLCLLQRVDFICVRDALLLLKPAAPDANLLDIGLHNMTQAPCRALLADLTDSLLGSDAF